MTTLIPGSGLSHSPCLQAKEKLPNKSIIRGILGHLGTLECWKKTQRKGFSKPAAIPSVLPDSRERNMWTELRSHPAQPWGEARGVGGSLTVPPPSAEPAQALSRVPGQLPLPARQVLRCGSGHRRQGGAVWPACGLSEAVAHVEGTGRAGAAAPCGPGLCPCPVGVGTTALRPLPALSVLLVHPLCRFCFCISAFSPPPMISHSLITGTWWRS